ncbi:hypothetical protein [Paenibacillus sp. 1001270B_150601_E10]|uniref:hypothetical protein n=1 Tax=Paenibacillus sp. 1001270B_150601_E10 TaxID=2787079 RepID=UPI0018A110AE|nr:hypothetical protein [Paenibacillus sp. 1001270B_150601_E10]
MTMVGASAQLLERLIATEGIAVRNHSGADAFWYASGIPGPFYINTENIAGKEASCILLEQITTVLESSLPASQASKTIFDMIIDVVVQDEEYQRSIEALLDHYLANRSRPPAVISGGERRDWFFSIPMASILNLPHLFLFKSGQHHVTDDEGNALDLHLVGQRVLHVADIINAASSYVDRWIPILREAGAAFSETLVVAVRNKEGIENLKHHQIAVISPLTVDRTLFTEAFELGLIPESACKEIHLFYDSPKDWTRGYLTESGGIPSSVEMDRKKKERLYKFRTTDPYGLKSEFPSYFTR